MQRHTITAAPVPVSSWALQQRLNKVLLAKGKVLKKSRLNQQATYGDFFIVDLVATNGVYVERHHIDLEKLGREIGVLKQYEVVEQ